MLERCVGRRRGVAVLIASCFALLSLNWQAKADIIYSLENVSFSDGSSAAGTFAINQYGYLSSWNIVTSDHATFDGYDYTPTINAMINNPLDTVLVFNRAGYNGFLQLTFSLPLTDPAARLNDPLVLSGSYECAGYEHFDAHGNGYCSSNTPAAYVVSGDVVDPVPEPTSAALLGSGVLALLAAAFGTRRNALKTAAP